jgi:hypothetical protein
VAEEKDGVERNEELEEERSALALERHRGWWKVL